MPTYGQVDTSSYPTATAAQQDPLAMIGKVLQIQSAQQTIQNQQMEFKARSALGPILQQSINPQTGELDVNKFLLHGASNPDVAWKMPEITLQMIQRQNTQADTVIKELTANKVRYGAMGDAAGALVAEAEAGAANKVNLQNGGKGTPGITSKQIASTLSTMVGENGLIDAKDAAEILTKTASMTDAQRFQYVKNFATAARGVDKTMSDIYGAIEMVNTGGSVQPVQKRPLIGQARPAGGAMEITPTPAELNAATTGVDAQNRPTIRPRVEAAPMYGGSGAQIAGSGQGAPAGAGGPAANVTGLSPQEQKLAEGRAAKVVEYETQLDAANTAGQNTARILGEMESALKEFKAGNGLAIRGKFADIAEAIGLSKSVKDKIAAGDRGAIQEFEKLAAGYAVEQMKQFMGSSQRLTNLDFSTFQNVNPKTTTDIRAIRRMMQFARHGIDQIAQQADAYKQWRGTEDAPAWRPNTYKGAGLDQFPTWWNKTLADSYKKEKVTP